MLMVLFGEAGAEPEERVHLKHNNELINAEHNRLHKKKSQLV